MICISILRHILASKYVTGCACSVLFNENILKCVVEHIATDLYFKTNYTLAMACGRNSTTIYTVLYIKMVHISKCINTVLF